MCPAGTGEGAGCYRCDNPGSEEERMGLVSSLVPGYQAASCPAQRQQFCLRKERERL